MAYAKGTEVSVEKSEMEIKALLRKHGAEATAFFQEASGATIVFAMKDRRITFRLPLPDRNDNRFKTYMRGSYSYARTETAAYQQWEQACRERWRALLLCIKAKLESVESGIETFEDAFLAHVTMPDGKTVGEHARPRIAQAYESGTMQALLPGPTAVQ